MKDKFIPFVAGVVFGHYGLRPLWHISYASFIVAAFFIGWKFHS